MSSVSPEKNRVHQRAWRKRNPEEVCKTARSYKARLRAEFVAEYGGMCVGTADGAFCQWSVVDPDALTIGHLFNDGGECRRRVGASRTVLVDLRQRNWPKDEGIAVQCGSCQMIDHRRSYREVQ